MIINGKCISRFKIPNYLCFTSNAEGSTVTLAKSGSPSWVGSYSLDGGNWSPYTLNTVLTLNANEKVYFKGSAVSEGSYIYGDSDYLQFTVTGNVSASGNVMSICGGDDFASATSIPYSYAFYRLFYNATGLVSPPEFPSIASLPYACCKEMFYGCTGLLSAPELPATSLAGSSYASMFVNCSAMATAPSVLNITSMTSYSCNRMFYGCSAMRTPPTISLPSTVSDYACGDMFHLSGISQAPALNATSVGRYAFQNMFMQCYYLTTPSTLSATTVGQGGYEGMFSYCTNLESVPNLPATSLGTGAYGSMFRSCGKLKVSDTYTADTTNAWTIPTSGMFDNNCTNTYMFIGCDGTRSTNSPTFVAGSNKTYYTQNEPI